jgi:RNA-binding protein
MEKLQKMNKLSGTQRKYLRGLAHSLTPVVIIGQNGVTDTLIEKVDFNLDIHELIKIKFNEFKEEKKELSKKIEENTKSEMVGMIGHTAIFYRENEDEEKRAITLP